MAMNRTPPGIARCQASETHPSPAASTAPATRAPPMTNKVRRSILASALRRLDHGGGAVGDDLAHGLTDLGRIEAHHHDGVRAHDGGVVHHPVDGAAPCVL